MSDTTENKSFQSPSWVRSACWVLIGVVAGIMIGYCIFTATLRSSVDEAVKQMQTQQTQQIEVQSEVTAD